MKAVRSPRTSHWLRSAVIYELYTPSFADSDGDGVGDLRGIMQRLDYLTWLGVDAIWLTPFYVSPMVDNGYDVADHTDVDPIFGDLAVFEALVAAVHDRQLKLLIDFVPNHTSDRHAWFAESRADSRNAKRDWYVWSAPAAGGGPPNNWLSVFGGSAWELDPTTSEYYLHSFLAEQPDLNWRNDEVVDAMLAVLQLWLDRGVDGIRIDAATYIMKDPELRDNPLRPAERVPAYRDLGDYDGQVHLFDKGHSDIHRIFRMIRHTLEQYQDYPRVALAELHYFDWPDWMDHWVRCYGETLDELDLPLNLTMVTRPWDASAFARMVDAIEKAIPTGAWPNLMLGGHDYVRVATRYGPDRARLAMVMLLTLRGTPIIYYGDEIGLENVDIPAEQTRDPWGQRVPGIGLDRDAARTPLPWDGTATAGFCAADVVPWLPLGDPARTVNVECERHDPDSHLLMTRRLLQCRREHVALQSGEYRLWAQEASDCFVYERYTDQERIVIALNFSSSPHRFTVPSPLVRTIFTNTGSGLHRPAGSCELEPFEGLVALIE